MKNVSNMYIIRRTDLDSFQVWQGNVRIKVDLMGIISWFPILSCGKVVAAIADGCGSGKRAFIESRMVIELMENA